MQPSKGFHNQGVKIVVPYSTYICVSAGPGPGPGGGVRGAEAELQEPDGGAVRRLQLLLAHARHHGAAGDCLRGGGVHQALLRHSAHHSLPWGAVIL